jgi:hypothetical protein
VHLRPHYHERQHHQQHPDRSPLSHGRHS